MIKSKELADPNSCLNRTRDDEPIFVLCARDVLAPIVVRFWAVQYHKLKNRQPGGIKRKQVEKQAEALRLADQAHHWRIVNAKANIEATVGHPVESVEQIVVDGEVKLIGVDLAEPKGFSEAQVKRAFAAADVRMPTTSEEAELMVKLGMSWLEANDPAKLTERAQRSALVCKLASELCNALDAAAEDVGGHRNTRLIIEELGPACDAYEGR